MSSVWNRRLAVSLFGESHGPAVGVVVDGLPSGVALDMEEIAFQMRRRAPGRSALSTARAEADMPEILSGVFEGRTYDEMKGDAAYCAWLDSGCESACPNGESKAVFCKRVCRAFEKLAYEALARGDERLVIVAHGGTQMAALSRFAEPHRDYYSWNAPPAGGFVLSADEWRARRALRVIKTVGYAEERT